MGRFPFNAIACPLLWQSGVINAMAVLNLLKFHSNVTFHLFIYLSLSLPTLFFITSCSSPSAHLFFVLLHFSQLMLCKREDYNEGCKEGQTPCLVFGIVPEMLVRFIQTTLLNATRSVLLIEPCQYLSALSFLSHSPCKTSMRGEGLCPFLTCITCEHYKTITLLFCLS